jgi:hypothetical protein
MQSRVAPADAADGSQLLSPSQVLRLVTMHCMLDKVIQFELSAIYF